MIEIIVPAAGLSSRFPDMKPKYLLYGYDHKLMLQKSLQHYMDHSITIGILKEHDEKYDAKKFIEHEFGSKVKVVVLDELSRGPADTVYQIIKKSNIDLKSELLVKDCDSFFNHEITSGNYVCVSNIEEHEVLNRLSSKSFVISNEQGIITNIIEKQVVSNTFCVGGYKFESAQLFMDAFERTDTSREIYVSDVIQTCLFDGEIITKKHVSDYYDVGTAQDWFNYNDKPVIFCDIDGTLIQNQTRVGENNYYSEVKPLCKNVKRMLELQDSGAQFIFTTSRPQIVEERTREILNNLGFKNYQLLIGLLNSKRIIINDYNSANPHPRAEAINIYRNSDNLSDYI